MITYIFRPLNQVILSIVILYWIETPSFVIKRTLTQVKGNPIQVKLESPYLISTGPQSTQILKPRVYLEGCIILNYIKSRKMNSS